MMKQTRFVPVLLVLIVMMQTVGNAAAEKPLAKRILEDERLDTVHEKAQELIGSGFQAGGHYAAVWIRDLNTFLKTACAVHPPETLAKQLRLFFCFQGEDGNIPDGITPREQATVGDNFIDSDLAPNYRAHKNTVETDQESSLVQAVYQFTQHCGQNEFLQETIGGMTVLERLQDAIQYLLDHRYADEYGLIWGGTTADWGDVQPEDDWGVNLTEDSHRAIDIYDNAMLVIALQNLQALLPPDSQATQRWTSLEGQLRDQIREHLWDEEEQKFIPNIYLEGSPFPADFDESQIDYHGGTAVAIQAGILTKAEVAASLRMMRENVREAGAQSIGLSLHPAYPEGFFLNPILTKPYTYQNGGDWTWFGARMIQGLIDYGFIEEAYAEIDPMVQRVIDNDGFYEWYQLDGTPAGSANYRGSAGVLDQAILELQAWAQEHASQGQ